MSAPPVMTRAQRDLLRGFGLTTDQRLEVWLAWCESPEGVERCALDAKARGRREGKSGAALLLVKIRASDHLVDVEPEARSVTGWRFVRGSHSGTYKRDPRGTDRLPDGYAVSS